MDKNTHQEEAYTIDRLFEEPTTNDRFQSKSVEKDGDRENPQTDCATEKKNNPRVVLSLDGTGERR